LPAADLAVLLASQSKQAAETLEQPRTESRQAEIQACLAEMSSRRVAAKLSVTRWRTAKHALLSLALTFAGFQYYAIDVLLQILSLPQLTIFVPGATTALKSMLGILTVFA
jgi:hypothetical protein